VTTEGPAFPLSAMVGADTLRTALLLCAVDPAIGGVLVRGEKGSGKTTAARGLADVLGDRAPFVELPLGATEDRVVGTLDIRAALAGEGYRFQPGLLAAAHGGVLYVDEVNLLADHLVDVLLDAAASGTNRIERDGVSHVHPSRFVLVGSMNPEEGELRPQLLDRFGLSVEVRAPGDPAARAEALRRRMAFDRDPESFARRWDDAQEQLRRRLGAARPAELRPGLEERVAALCADAGAEGLRADLVVCRAAAALAGWEGRGEADEDDVRRVAALALGHRRAAPWPAPSSPAAARLDELLDRVFADRGGARQGSRGPEGAGSGTRGDGVQEGPDLPEDPGRSAPGGGAGEGAAATREERRGAGGAASLDPAAGGGRAPVDDGGTLGDGPLDSHDGGRLDSHDDGSGNPPGAVPRGLLDMPGSRPGSPGGASGRRAPEPGVGGRGRLVGSRLPGPGEAIGTVAVAATVASATGRLARQDQLAPGAPLAVGEGDLREAVHRRPTANLVVLAVDTSGSMGVDDRVRAAHDAVASLLVDAYQRRDRVAVVAFQGTAAHVVLRPTGSTEVAAKRLAGLPRGGTTPLAAGIHQALRVAVSPSAAPYRPLLVVVTDGRATWAADGRDPVEASLEAAAEARRAGVGALVVDCERTGTPLGLAQPLADALGGRLVRWDALAGGGTRADGGPVPGEVLAGVVRQVLAGG